MISKIALSLVLASILLGCSVDTPIAKSFFLPKGSEIEIQLGINTSHTDKELIFDLIDVPETKKDRDYSDFISVTIMDNSGQKYTPDKISDVNGAKRDIIAIFNKIPKGTKIQTIKIRALQDIKGSGIRWWCGKLL